MKHSNLVFCIQYKLFIQDKGMLIFYLLLALIMGFLVPTFYKGIETIILFLSMITIMLTKPILADSLASEREHKTLESILSTSMIGKHIIWGKFMFSLFFSVLFFSITTTFMILTFHFSNDQLHLLWWQWICIFMGLLLNLITICIAGVYRSVHSDNSYTANSNISKITYGLIFLQVVYLSIIFQAHFIPALIVTIPFLLIELCVICNHIDKIQKIKQLDFLENIKTKNQYTTKTTATWMLSPKSQFETVLRHEFKYLLKLKTLLINFMILCACPAFVVCILKYYLGTVNLYYGVILTTLMIPRAPVNLIAYSIGGEKSYKTGESLLSTPIHLMPLFLAKSMIPVFISTIMLLLSSLLTLIGANIIGNVLESGNTYLYTKDQLMLLFPIAIMSCITMVFLTGIFSVSMKTPRQGLYASSIIGLVFVIPLLLIVYLTQNPFLWSVIYFIMLLLINIVLLKEIVYRVTRPVIIGKL